MPMRSMNGIIAGAFGTYLDLSSALRVGMFPEVPLERFHRLGMQQVLVQSRCCFRMEKREEANEVVKGIKIY